MTELTNPSFRVATFNIAGWMENPPNAWESRKDVNIETIKAIEPDIIGFQELHIKNIFDYRYGVRNLDFALGLNEGNGMYPNTTAWNRGRFRLLGKGGFWLSEQPGMMLRSWDADLPRACSWAGFEDLFTNQKLIHFNLHLDHIGEKARIESTRLVIEHVDRCPQDTPIVVAGDFNCSPHKPIDEVPYSSKPYDLLKMAGFADAYAFKKQADFMPNTFHNFQGEDYLPDQFGTWYIDWIMIKNLAVRSAEIFRISKPEYYASDHYPVIADLEFLR